MLTERWQQSGYNVSFSNLFNFFLHRARGTGHEAQGTRHRHGARGTASIGGHWLAGEGKNHVILAVMVLQFRGLLVFFLIVLVGLCGKVFHTLGLTVGTSGTAVCDHVFYEGFLL